MSVSASQVKELREKTGAGMMDCKKALDDANGDIDAAVKALREKGLAAASKKADRAANEGRVFTGVEGSKGVILEMSCETDFVAGNDDFIAVGDSLVAAILASSAQTLEDLSSLTINGESYDEFIPNVVLKLGENISVKRFDRVESDGAVFNYTHMNGKIGVLVDYSGSVEESLGRGIAMHVAAASPQYLNSSEVPQAEVDAEKEIMKNQVLAEGKPENIVDKIVEGKINKYFKEICLVDQAYVVDPSTSISKALPSGVEIRQFIRYAQG